MPFYLRMHPLPWLTAFVGRGHLSSDEAERLRSFAEMFGSRLYAVETEVVFYAALGGDGTAAIEGFAVLLRCCRHFARCSDGTLEGWCRAKVVTDAAKTLESNVMSYLPNMLDAPADTVRLTEVVSEYGWTQRRAAVR